MAGFLALVLVLTTTLLVACANEDATDQEEGRQTAGRKAPDEANVAAEARATGHTTATDEVLARASAALRLQAEDPNDLGAGRPYAYIPALAYADLSAAREQLDLPAGARLRPGKHRLLFTFATRPLFMFSMSFWPDPSLGALAEVLDSGQIDVAAGTNFALSGPVSDEVGPDDVLVISTRQPFEEIAGRLQEAGYEDHPDGLLVGGEPLPEPDGDVRFASSYDGIPFPVVGDAGGGVVVLGGSERAVLAALNDHDRELTEVAELVAGLPGVSRAARGGFGRSSCVVAIGLGEDASPRRGELVVVVKRRADAERHHFGGLSWPATFFSNEGGPEANEGEIRFAEAIAEGKRAIAPFTSTDELNATRLAIENVEDPYGCE